MIHIDLTVSSISSNSGIKKISKKKKKLNALTVTCACMYCRFMIPPMDGVGEDVTYFNSCKKPALQGSAFCEDCSQVGSLICKCRCAYCCRCRVKFTQD